MSLCSNNNKVYPVSWWSLLILSWWKLINYVFACDLSLVLFYIVALLYFSLTIHWCVFWGLCCFGHNPFSLHFQIIQMFMLILAMHQSLYHCSLHHLFLFCCLWHLLPEVVFCLYWGDLHMFLHPSYYASSLHHTYFVTCATVIIWPMPNYCSMYQQSSIFLLHCCRWFLR